MADVDSLVPHPLNANKHSDKQIALLGKIISFQGFRSPITVSKRSGYIVAGHGRLMAAKAIGLKEVPVDEQDFPNEAAEFAHLTADNKVAELAEHDDAFMIKSAEELGIDDFELLGLSDFKIDLPEINNTSEELDISSFDNFQHECPKCGFEWNDNGTT
jgi:hypothetical protein